MNAPARLILVLGCLVLAAIELPRGTELVVDDLDGPYGARAVVAAPAAFEPQSAAPDSVDSGLAASSHSTMSWNRDADRDARRDGWDEVSTLGDEPEERNDDDRGDGTYSFDAHLAGH